MLKKFLADNRYWAGAAVVLLACLGLSYCVGRGNGRSGEVTRQLERTIELEQDASKADAAAAEARLSDHLTISEQKKELDDAIARNEDADTLRARRGCLILRQQGRDTTALASCRRFEAGR